jgi:hypothetical protein
MARKLFSQIETYWFAVAKQPNLVFISRFKSYLHRRILMRFCGATTLSDIQYNDTQYDNKKFSA